MTDEAHDYLALTAEFEKIKAETDKIAELQRKEKDGQQLAAAEKELVAKLPDLINRGMEVSMILRRTNTGPAQVKTKKPSKAALSAAAAEALLNMEI